MRHLACGDAGRPRARACSPLSCLSTCDAILQCSTLVLGFLFFFLQQRLQNGNLGHGKQGRGGADNVHVSNCPRTACSGSRALCGTDCVCVCAVVCARIPPSLTARAGRYERRTPLVSSCGFAEQISGCQRAACRFVTAVYGSAMRTRILENTDFAPTFFRCCRKPADHSALWYHAISPCRPHACKRLNWNGHEGQRWVMPKSNGERWHWRQASSHEQVSVPRTSAGRLLGINKMQDDNRDQERR